MLFLSVRGFSDYAGPTVHSRLAWLPCCLPPTQNEVGILIYGLFAAQSPRPPMPLVYASRNTSRCPLQDSRSGWIRYFLSCRALASPTTCRFSPAHSELPVAREASVQGRRRLLTPITLFFKLGKLETLRALRQRDRGEALQRSLANAQRAQFLFAQLFGAACNYPHSALDEYLPKLRIGRRSGDVTEGPQQP